MYNAAYYFQEMGMVYWQPRPTLSFSLKRYDLAGEVCLLVDGVPDDATEKKLLLNLARAVSSQTELKSLTPADIVLSEPNEALDLFEKIAANSKIVIILSEQFSAWSDSLLTDSANCNIKKFNTLSIIPSVTPSTMLKNFEHKKTLWQAFLACHKNA